MCCACNNFFDIINLTLLKNSCLIFDKSLRSLVLHEVESPTLRSNASTTRFQDVNSRYIKVYSSWLGFFQGRYTSDFFYKAKVLRFLPSYHVLCGTDCLNSFTKRSEVSFTLPLDQRCDRYYDGCIDLSLEQVFVCRQ